MSDQVGRKRYYPTMKLKENLNGEADDMYCVHGHAINRCRKTVLDCLRKLISKSSYWEEQSIQLADFGTADGRASLCLLNEMINIIQTDLGRDQPIVVYYNDLPRNDFNLLSKVILGDSEVCGLRISGKVYPVLVPKTMYEQCLPENSLDLSISAIAGHYLSEPVCQIKHGVFIGEASDNEQRLMKEQAKTDWRNFVISRGRELKPGGFLITINVSSDEENNVVSQLDKGIHHLGSFVTDMARDGIISQDEYLGTNFNGHYMRKACDFKEPFTSSLPEIETLGLELVSVTSMKHHLRHPTFDIIDKDDSEKQEYSRQIVASVRSWMNHVILGGLSASRTEEEKQNILEEFFDRVQKYAYTHSDHKPYLILTEVVIKKKNVT